MGMLDVDRIRAALRTQRIGRRIVHIESTTSTNDEAWKLVEGEPVGADGTVVFAEQQTAGRGRLGRGWVSPKGASLLCSVVVVDAGAGPAGGELGLIAAVAACDAVKATTELLPSIKWPNDLLVRGRKLGGILVESRGHGAADGGKAYVVGIGINCLQQRGHFAGTIASTGTSLDIESSHAIDRSSLAAALLSELDRWLAEPDRYSADRLRRAWLDRAEAIGGRIALCHADKVYSGTVLDVDPHAALVVQLDEGGVRKFDAADTTVADEPTPGGG